MKKITTLVFLILMQFSYGSWGITHYNPKWDDVVELGVLNEYKTMGSLESLLKLKSYSSGYYKVFFKSKSDYSYVVKNHSHLFNKPIGGMYWHVHPSKTFYPKNGINVYYNKKTLQRTNFSNIKNKYPEAYDGYMNYMAVSCANLARDYNDWDYPLFFARPLIINAKNRVGDEEVWLGWDDSYFIYAMPAGAFKAIQTPSEIKANLITNYNLVRDSSSHSQIKITADFSRAGSLGKVKLDGK